MSSFIEKILAGNAGEVVTVEPDYAVINDYDVPTGRPEAAAILRNNLNFADKYGCRYIQARGVGYQYMLNEVVKPVQIHHVRRKTRGNIRGKMRARNKCQRSRTCGVSAMDAAFAFLKDNRSAVSKKAIEIYTPGFSQPDKEVFLQHHM